MSKDKMKKGIWVIIDNAVEFREKEKEFIQALKKLEFSDLGISIKTRYGTQGVSIIRDFTDLWKEQGLKVFAFVVCLIDENVNKSLYCKNSKKDTVFPYICPTKACKEDYTINYEDNQITYLKFLKKMLEEVTKYNIDGVHLLEFGYPSFDTCWCKECRKIFKFEEGEFENPQNLREWVNQRAEIVNKIYKNLIIPIKDSNKYVIGSITLDFESYGRLGQKIFHGVDFEEIKKNSDLLSICVEPYLGLEEMETESINKTKIFFRYTESQIVPTCAHFTGIISYKDYEKVDYIMREIDIPYLIIVPSQDVIIKWGKEV